MSVDLTETAKIKQNVENKKRKPVYDKYDDSEFQEPGFKKNILSQYDQEIMGPKEIGFKINQEIKVSKQTISEKLRGTLSLDFDKNKEIQDYYQPQEITFKKSKKKIKNSRKKTMEELDFIKSELPIQSNKTRNVMDMNVIDDDDLQDALARTRRLAAAERKDSSLEEFVHCIFFKIYIILNSIVVKDIKNESSDEEQDGGGLIISETTEFVLNLSNQSFNLENKSFKKDTIRDSFKVEEIESNEMQVDTLLESHSLEHEQESHDQEEEESTPIIQEPLVSGGIAATLALLSQKGLVTKRSEHEKEYKSQESKRKDKHKVVPSQEKLKNYNPDVKIAYYDEFGRELGPKEVLFI